MTTLDIPVLTIQVSVSGITSVSTLPWYNPTQFPVVPPNPAPAALQKANEWSLTMAVTSQNQSSYLTRQPGKYNGFDIYIGMWIANINTGQAWQIVSITSATTTSVVAVVQDVFRYNTFRDASGQGNASPSTGNYIVFQLDQDGVPQIDPLPSTATSIFFANLTSRFQYYNTQYNYALYQAGNTFVVGDAVAVTSSTGSPASSFVLAGEASNVVVGTVTTVSDVSPGWFTINPVQKVADYINYLPGNVGDVLYASLSTPGQLTTTPGGNQIYVKLRNNTQTITNSTVLNGTTTVGNVFQVNGVNATVAGSGAMSDVVAAINAITSSTGVSAAQVLSPTQVTTNPSLVNTTYGSPLLYAASTPYATATINGVLITFNTTSTQVGLTNYCTPIQMAQLINAAAIPNITASAPNLSTLIITNSSGGAITIVNGASDVNGIYFAGTNSGSGLALSTSASTSNIVQATAVDARAIQFLDVSGHTVSTDIGLVSAQNGITAAGLSIQQGLRTATTTVVTNIAAMNALSPLVGDQAYVLNSDDGQGNNVNEWSLWLWNGSAWVQTDSQNSSGSESKSLEYGIVITTPSTVNIGTIGTGGRVTLITINVVIPFLGGVTPPTLNIGYTINNIGGPTPVPSGLMTQGEIDLTTIGTYTTAANLLFGVDTPTGDVVITAAYTNGSATGGSAKIVVSYV